MTDSLKAPLEHPDAEQLRDFLDELVRWSLDHFLSLPEREVGRTASRSEMEQLLREPAPSRGRSLEDVFRRFREQIAPFAMRPGHPRFLAFIPGAPTFVSVLGEWLGAVTNFFCGVWLEAAGPTEVEIVVLDWFKEFLGYPGHARGILTSGGSEANLLALVVAREALSQNDRDRAVLYVSGQRHWSVDRAARIMGLRHDQLRQLAADSRGRLEPTTLLRAVDEDRRGGRRPWAVVANAGTTNTGAVDPLDELATLCRKQKLWLHVDAAYGWSAVLIEEGRRTLRGIDQADSITLDPHKWFAQTFDVGCLLVREGHLLEQTFAMRPDYMQDVVPAGDELNFADHGLALTRRFKALKIWLSMQVLGLEWFRALVERCCRLADLAQLLLERTGCFEIVSPRQLSIVCFRYAPRGVTEAELDALNLALCEKIRQTGRAFLSTTRLNNCVALRMCFVNWRTVSGDVEEVVELLVSQASTREQ